MDPPLSSVVDALQSRYRLERELGRGGMATVYLAHDLRHDRRVAVKVLRPELSDLIGRDRFLREIEIAARLQHPNILPLFDSGSAPGALYYVMPYVDGESLRDRLDREKQLSLDEALAIAGEIADALAYAHRQGVVHRDIKPGNILLSGASTGGPVADRGHALVADFGIARAIRAAGTESRTTRGIAVGTPAYMSPEQAGGQDEVDERSDLYSLACVVYEMLAGQPPFTGRTPQAIAARHLHEPPPSLRVVRPSLPPGIQVVVETALAKVRADRYPTVGRFVSALEEARHPRGTGGRRLKLGLAAASAAAILSGVVWRYGLPNEATLDQNKVVVFPLVEVSASRPTGIGEAIAVMIESALEHTEPLRWIDGWQQLSPEQRADPALLSGPAALRIARERRARWYTTGTAVHRGDSITVVLRLNDARGDSILSHASESALSAGAAQAGLHAVSELLVPILAPGRSVDLSALGDRRPAAVASWLQGEREYRRGDFDSALAYLRRAVQEDSALALAAARGAQAATWKNLLPEAAELGHVALASIALLPDRQAELTRGLVHYLGGQADSAVQWMTRALVRTPDWVEAHMALGEVYYHLLPTSDLPIDSLAESRFLAAAADTGFAPPHFHLAEIAVRGGDLERGERELRRFGRLGGGRDERRQLELMLGCARGGPASVEWRTAAREEPRAALAAAKMLSVAGTYPECVEAGARALLVENSDEAQGGFHLLRNLWAAENRIPELITLADSVKNAGWWQVGSLVYPIDALAGLPGLEPKVEESIAALRTKYGQRYEDSLDAGRRLMLGAWYARAGRITEAERLEALLSRQATTSTDPAAPVRADALQAHLLLARGDSAEALQVLEGLVPVSPSDLLAWGNTEALPAERLLLAELLFSSGRHRGAMNAADGFDHPAPLVFLPFLPASLALRYRAARVLAEPDRAEGYRRRLIALNHGHLIGGRNRSLP
jgi:serine/threonine protein kinase